MTKPDDRAPLNGKLASHELSFARYGRILSGYSSKMSTNEPIVSYRKVAAGSERNFGFVFAAVFAIVGLLPWWHSNPIRLWALGVAVVLVAVAWLAPWVLAPFNRLWFRLGLVLHHVVNPIVMALLFYGAVVPMGLLLKARGKD